MSDFSNITEPLLEARGLTVTFGRAGKRFAAVDGVSFHITRGETFGLVGESGSGKTTIARTIMRINQPSQGEILYNCERISGAISPELKRRLTCKIQMIFQDPMSSLNERAKLRYIVAEGLYNIGNSTERQRRVKVARALAEVGLPPSCADRFPHQLSGGQRQRAAIARALVMEPQLIIADEPVSALDIPVRAQVLNLMNELKRRRELTYFFISHDLSVMSFMCDRIAVVNRGRLVELADTQTLFRNPRHPYTKALLAAVPVPDPDRERNKQRLFYAPPVYDNAVYKPVWTEIEPGHFVLV